MNPETRYTGLAALLLGLVVLVGSAESGFAQDLVPDDPTALGERFPLILIHGWCGNEGTWDSFRQFFTASPALASRFKLYSFNFPTGPGQVPIPICPNVNRNHTVERVRLLARHLKEVALPGIEGLIPGREIALLAHSLGGLIARSYLQEYEISHPPLCCNHLGHPTPWHQHRRRLRSYRTAHQPLLGSLRRVERGTERLAPLPEWIAREFADCPGL